MNSFLLEMLWSVVILVVGFVLLIKGADYFVEGSSSVAKRLRVPSIIIGLTIVAMGTSLPECAVSITASLEGQNALAVSNVIGSNIFNILFVLAASAAISPMAVDALSVIDALVLIVFSILVWFMAKERYEISRKEGVIMVVLYLIYTVYIILR